MNWKSRLNDVLNNVLGNFAWIILTLVTGAVVGVSVLTWQWFRQPATRIENIQAVTTNSQTLLKDHKQETTQVMQQVETLGVAVAEVQTLVSAAERNLKQVRQEMTQLVSTIDIPIQLDTCGVYNAPLDEAPSTGRIEALGRFQLQNDDCIRPDDPLLDFTWVGFSFIVNGQAPRLEGESVGSFVTFYDEPIQVRDDRGLLFFVRGEGEFLDLKVRLVLDDPALPADSRGKEVVILESPPLSALDVVVEKNWQQARLDLAEFRTVHIRRRQTNVDLTTLNKLVFIVDNAVAEKLLELAAGQPDTEPVISGRLFVRDIVFTWR